MTSDTNTHAEQQQEPERKHQHVNIEIGQTEKITENPDVYLEVQHPCWSCNSNSSSANASAGVR